MKQQSTAREAYLKASLQFSPKRLSSFIIFDEDIPIVEKSRLLRSKYEETLFSIALNHFYQWDYKTGFDSVTVYFEVPKTEEGIIIAGTYDQIKHSRITRVVIAKKEGNARHAPYTFTNDVFQEIKDKISKKS